MFLRLCLCLVVLVLSATAPAVAQCSSVKKQTFLVSDRYYSAARHNQHLLLANSYGIVFRGIEQTDPNPLHIQPLSGNITQVLIQGDRVYAMALGQGVHILSYLPAQTFPEYQGFSAIAGVKEILVQGEVLFARQDQAITLHRIFQSPPDASDSQIATLNAIPGKATLFTADSHHVYIRRSDASGWMHPYNAESGAGDAVPLAVDQSNAYYRLHLTDKGLIVDGLTGVRLVNISPNGSIQTNTVLFTNRGETILGSYAQGNRLYMRYGNRIEVYSLSANSKQLIGSIPQAFTDQEHLLVGTGEFLHQLNRSPQRRTWSFTTYPVGATIGSANRQLARFEELIAGVSFHGKIYLAANRDIFRGEDVVTNPANQLPSPVISLPGNIQGMVASTNLLYVTTSQPGTGATSLYVFEAEPNGTLRQAFLTQITGTLSSLSQFNDQLAFVRNIRTTTEEIYEVNVLSRSNSTFQLNTDTEQFPLGTPNPFVNLHLSELGLAYARNDRIWIYDNPADLADFREQLFPEERPFLTFVASGAHFWLQTADQGILLYKANGTLPATEAGRYGHWRNLRRLPDNQIMAQNNLRPKPGSFHLLSLEEGEIVNDRVDFSTTDEPIFILTLPQGLLPDDRSQPDNDLLIIGERASMNIFEIACPDQNFVYYPPYIPNLELDLNTALDPADVATLIILNADNETIGYQDLDPDLIETYNGSRISDWLFDYDSLQEPASFFLMSSKPIAPVLAGNTTGNPRSRFAYRVSLEASPFLYIPHIPKDNVWTTQVGVRALAIDDATAINVYNPGGNLLSTTPFGSQTTALLTLNAGAAPWGRITSNDAITLFSGFVVFSGVNNPRAAAVPLRSTLNQLLILPYLAGRDQPDAWTGMVLSNPNLSETTVRIIGYGPDGNISRDRFLTLEPNGTFSTSVEEWLAAFDPTDDTRWLLAVSDQPIMGTVLFGSNDNRRLSGIPMTDEAGDSLVFTGIRSTSRWETRLVVTNQDRVLSSLQILAIGGEGLILANKTLSIGPNEARLLSVSETFSELGEDIRRIHTIRITSPNQLSGFSTREDREFQTQESYSALVE